MPPLIFDNSAANKVLQNDEKTRMNVIKEGKPKLNSPMDLDETFIFKGNENILHVVSEMLPSAVRFPSNRIRSSSISGHNPSISGGPP